jgi:TolB-like protein
MVTVNGPEAFSGTVGDGNSHAPIPPDSIIQAMEGILGSQPFLASKVLQKFLRYIVANAIEGRSQLIKEYSIGVDVFGRGEHFDPRVDPIVRVEARKLRSRLAVYYESDGRHDAVLIEVPKGSYAPRFRRAALQADYVLAVARTAAVTTVPRAIRSGSVSVDTLLPFTGHCDDDEKGTTVFSGSVTNELIEIQMSGRLPGVRLVARTPALSFGGQNVDSRMGGLALNAGLMVRVSVQKRGDDMRVIVQLDDAKSGCQPWDGGQDVTLPIADSMVAEIADQNAVNFGNFEGPKNVLHSTSAP